MNCEMLGQGRRGREKIRRGGVSVTRQSKLADQDGRREASQQERTCKFNLPSKTPSQFVTRSLTSNNENASHTFRMNFKIICWKLSFVDVDVVFEIFRKIYSSQFYSDFLLLFFFQFLNTLCDDLIIDYHAHSLIKFATLRTKPLERQSQRSRVNRGRMLEFAD